MKSVAILLLSISSVVAGNWPQFRGPQASGVDSNGAAPTQWDVDKGQNLLWRTPIPGLGHSSPIIWEDQILVTTAVQPAKAELKVGLYGDIQPIEEGVQQWRLLALSKENGKVLWNKLGLEAMPRVKRHPKSSHCSSTPATDGKHIVAIFGSEGLFCFDMQGNLQWKKDLGPMDSAYYMVPSAQWGFATSPLLHDGKAVVLCDVLTNSFIALFDLRDGKELWRTPRKDVPTWGTPAIVPSRDATQILVNGWHHTGAYNFRDGKEIWHLDGGGDIPVPTPVLGHNLAYFTSGHGRFRPMRAVSLQASGDITPADPGTTNSAIPWAHARLGNYMQTPILVGDKLFGCVDSGVLSCFDAKSGKVFYSERLGNGSEGFTSSPISDGRNLFFASEVGNVYVVSVATQFSVSATNKLDDMCMATPAIAGGKLFYRTREHLLAIGSKRSD